MPATSTNAFISKTAHVQYSFRAYVRLFRALLFLLIISVPAYQFAAEDTGLQTRAVTTIIAVGP